MKKFFKYFIVVVLTLGIVVGTLYNDYKKSQAAVLPVAIWGMTESVLALFGAFGLGVGVNHAYKDSTVVDKDAIDLLQDFRGFLAKGSNLSLPYTLIESQLNTLERSLQEAQLKGYLTLIRGGVTGQETPKPDGPKKNKFEKGLIDSIKQYVVARHLIDKSNELHYQKPIGDLYDGDFYYNMTKQAVLDNGFKWSTYDDGTIDESMVLTIKNMFKDVIPSDLYFFGYRIINYDNYYGSYIEIYFSNNGDLKNSDLSSKTVASFRFWLGRNFGPWTSYYRLPLSDYKDYITSTNWKPLLDYKERNVVNDLGTDGRITVNKNISEIIDRDGNLDNYEIITPGTKVNPDGSVEGDITIPVPKRLPSNQPLPAGQTEPALEYGSQVDYGLGTDINGNIAINTIPTPGAAPVAGEWTADEQSGIEKSKNLSMLFPFCIPFDLIAAFKLLVATPQVPHWEFDWKIPTIGFSHHFVIDLASFNILFLILNKMILLSFIVGLILVTRNIIRG